MTGTSTRDRARGALLGLAVGDAAGFPALYHRTVRLGKRRGALWRLSAGLDQQQVLRFVLPTSSALPEALHVGATDDGEFAALTAIILLECAGDYSTDALFAGWQRHVVEPADGIWSGIAERASITNARRGLRPPYTGNDNPAHFDDGAAARAVAVGICFAGAPASAAVVARNLAEITHAADGVWAAEAMAATISAAVAGSGLRDAIEAGHRLIPADSWLSRQVSHALELAGAAASAFDVAAELSDNVANSSYSFGTVAPETLASAYALALAADGDPQVAIPAAATIAKQADSVPALVGAITGALAGAEQLPAAWASRVEVLRGICVPALEGVRLSDLADKLLDGGTATRDESQAS
ncbi:MAG TPA: ADP-ribosylglycohydrolase family protein [Streptosporangiaceae bacterium]|nr:ADP-ribosylglycohydrolase family protein [Streptosporangiaceae bacterium]